jgi:hypothetical protein
MNWKNKIKKNNQNSKGNNGCEIHNMLPESGQDLIGDQWQKVDEDFAFESIKEESVSPMFADEGTNSNNYISLDELANTEEHIKARKRLVKLEEFRETDPLNENSITINGNRIKAKFQEFQKSIYLANTGIFFLVLLSFVLKFLNSNVNTIFFICWAILCLVLFAFALLVYLMNPTVTVWLDESRNAIMSCSGLFTRFTAKKVTDYELFYHLHKSRCNRISFLHLDLKFEDGSYLSISGKTFESLRNDRAASGAENLQALGGEYSIQQIAKLLAKAKNCRKV